MKRSSNLTHIHYIFSQFTWQLICKHNFFFYLDKNPLRSGAAWEELNVFSGFRMDQTEPAHTTTQAQPAADNKIFRNWRYCSAAAKSPSHQCDNAKTIRAWIIVSGTLNIQDIWRRLRISFWNTNRSDLFIDFLFSLLLQQICVITTASKIFEAWSSFFV